MVSTPSRIRLSHRMRAPFSFISPPRLCWIDPPTGKKKPLARTLSDKGDEIACCASAPRYHPTLTGRLLGCQTTLHGNGVPPQCNCPHPPASYGEREHGSEFSLVGRRLAAPPTLWRPYRGPTTLRSCVYISIRSASTLSKPRP